MRPEERDPAYPWDMIEAARRVSSRFRNEHAEIPWKETVGGDRIEVPLDEIARCRKP